MKTTYAMAERNVGTYAAEWTLRVWVPEEESPRVLTRPSHEGGYAQLSCIQQRDYPNAIERVMA